MTTSNFNIINFSTEIPKFTEPRGSAEWVRYGEDNLFPIKLQDLSNRSALHNAIISSKVDNVCGDGLTYDSDIDPKTEAFINSPNPNETLNDILRKLAYDYILYGGCALNIIWDWEAKTISEIYHIDFANLRSGKENEDDEIPFYYYSKDWSNYRKSGNQPLRRYSFCKRTPYINIDNDIPIEDHEDFLSQVLYIKEYRPGVKYYPLPSYIGALGYIETDVEIASFHLSHIKNGMFPGMMITFTNGVPTLDEQKKTKQKFEDRFCGSSNTAKILMSFVDNKDQAPVLSTISPSQLDKQFIQLQETVMQNILSGHKVTSPMLVGIKTEGSLGGSTELATSWEAYFNSTIRPIQNILLRHINNIGKINGAQELNIITKQPVSFKWSEGILANILSVDEMREMIGIETMEDNVETINETKNNE